MAAPIVFEEACKVAEIGLQWAAADLLRGLGIFLEVIRQALHAVKCSYHPAENRRPRRYRLRVSESFSARITDLRATSKAHRFHAKLIHQHLALLWLTSFSIAVDLIASITY
jgi:hypothetical protein